MSSKEEKFGQAPSERENESYKARVNRALRSGGDCGTSERAYEIRQILESPEAEAEEYPSLREIEETWQFLIKHHYPENGGEPLVSRAELLDDLPFVGFVSLVSQGFYPPPEVMLSLEMCFAKYLASGGDISLDEAFFGRPHKKYESYAFHRKHIWKFAAFHNLYVIIEKAHLEKAGQSKISLESLAEQYLKDHFGSVDNAGIDIEAFLRDYRRWKKRYRM